jgi:chromosomal replication initiation ATPase DnaA
LKTVLKSNAESSLRLEEVFPAQLFANNSDLQSIYDRYLTFATPKLESDGVQLFVPTLFHKQALLRWKDQLEKLSGVQIKAVDVLGGQRPRRESAPVSNYHQVALPLVPQHPPKEVEEQKERERRSAAPRFVKGPSFELCYELAKRWSSHLFQPMASSQSILWVFGRAGSGKTHLLKQFNNWVADERRLHFVDVMAFFHEWRHALENNGTFQFIKKYRKDIDVLVLENLDDLIGKRGTQQELLFTVSALLEKGAYIVVSSSQNPVDLKAHIEPQLYSRLLSGMTIEMPEPDRVFKESLMRKLLDENGLKDYSMDLIVQEKLLSIPVSTARKCNTLYINAIARLSLNRTLSLQDVIILEHTHGEKVTSSATTHHKPQDLIDSVCKLCGVGPSALLGHGRRADITLARRFVCLALSKFLGLTNSTIAHYLEKDPSTISHALRTAENEIESNRIIAKQWNWICSQLGLEAPQKPV